MASGLDKDARIVFTKTANNGKVTVKIDNCSTASGSDSVDIEGTGGTWSIDKTGNALFTTVNGVSGAVTLDDAYDGGAAGLGRTVTADTGAVVVNALGNDTLQLNQLSNHIALPISSMATSEPLIELSAVSGNSRGDIAFGSARTGGDPSTTTAGDLWYNGTTNTFKYYDGTAIRILSTGIGGGGGNTLDQAYNQGGAGAGRAIMVNTGAVELCAATTETALEVMQTNASAVNVLNVINSGTGHALDITQAGSGEALFVNKTNTGTNPAVHIQNAGTGDALFVDQNGSGRGICVDTTGGAGLYVTSSNAAPAVLVKNGTDNSDALNISVNAGSGRGIFLPYVGTGTAQIISAGSSSNRALYITKTNGTAALINATAATGLNVVSSNGAVAQFIKNGTNSSEAVNISVNSGSGDGLQMSYSGTGRVIDLDQINTASVTAALDISNVGTGPGINIDQNAAGIGLNINVASASTNFGQKILNNGTGNALHIDQNGAASAALVIFNDGGTGAGFLLNHNTTGAALDINMGASGIAINIDQTSTTATATIININNSGSGKDIEGTSASWSFTKDGILQLGVFSDGTRPVAGIAGRVIFNSTDGQLNIDNGTNWTLPNGAIT